MSPSKEKVESSQGKQSANSLKESSLIENLNCIAVARQFCCLEEEIHVVLFDFSSGPLAKERNDLIGYSINTLYDETLRAYGI